MQQLELRRKALAAEGLHAEPIIPGAAGDVPTAP